MLANKGGSHKLFFLIQVTTRVPECPAIIESFWSGKVDPIVQTKNTLI
jgi:hypothetical protein